MVLTTPAVVGVGAGVMGSGLGEVGAIRCVGPEMVVVWVLVLLLLLVLALGGARKDLNPDAKRLNVDFSAEVDVEGDGSGLVMVLVWVLRAGGAFPLVAGECGCDCSCPPTSFLRGSSNSCWSRCWWM